jgi:hypothetical protein
VLNLCLIPNLEFNVFGMTTMIVMTTTVVTVAAAAAMAAAVAAAPITVTSWAISAHAWLSASLTNAFASPRKSS